MAATMRYALLFCILTAAASIRYVSSSSASKSTCNRQSAAFIHDLQFQCPLSISLSSPIEVDGETLDNVLKSSQRNVYIAVLFYADWCPFSTAVHSKFASLSAMFPQIKHLMVEQSSAMPSVFSRYGIHSLPSVLIVNQTVRSRYHGPKYLDSFVRFYKKTTGLEPVIDLSEVQTSFWESSESIPNGAAPLKERLTREPYLVLSIIFIFMKAFLYFFPGILSRVMALWFAYVRPFNFGILGESSQLLGRVFHLIDVKRVLSKLKLCKTRNFHERARSARVWASSLASVSLGETTSTRPFPSTESANL